MLKFLPGILLIQLTASILLFIAPPLDSWLNWLRFLIPLLIISLAVSFWFASISKSAFKDQAARLKDNFGKEKEKIKDQTSRLKTNFAKEKEKIRLNAERAKTRLVKQSQKEIAKEAKRTHTKANFKVGASFASVVAIGAFMLLTEILMLGIITLTTAGGALGGYLYRAKKGPIKSFPKIKNVSNLGVPHLGKK